MSDEIDDIEVGTGSLARVLGLTPQRVGQLATARVLQKRGRGRFMLAEAVRAYVGWLRDRPTGADGSGAALDYATERARLTKLQADVVEIDLAERRGRVISIDDVLAPLTECCTAVRQRLLAMPSRVTPRLIGCDHAAVFKLLHEEIRAILTELSADEDMKARAEKAGVASDATVTP